MARPDPSFWPFADAASIEGRVFDVCVVGSGITGCLAAEHFVRRGQRVLVLERGTDVYLPASRDEEWFEDFGLDAQNERIAINTWPGAEKHFDDLARIENERKDWGFFYNMKYGLGGSGAVWSGASYRFLPEDFMTRTNLAYGRDWPIGYHNLEPFYDEAETVLETSGPHQDENFPWKANYKYPAFKHSYLDGYIAERTGWKLSAVPFAVRNLPGQEGGCVGARNCVHDCPANAVFRPHWRLLYPLRNDANLTVALGVPCLRLHAGSDGAIESVEVLGAGKTLRIKARLFVLAANAIENLRILLASPDAQGRAMANSSGKLGLGFASHGALVVGVTARDPVYPGRGRPTTSSVLDGLRNAHRARLNGYRLEIWNGDFFLRFNPFETLSRLRLRRKRWGKELVEAAQLSARQFSLTYFFELEMSDRNRVRLSEQRDRFGMPLALVDYQRTERDTRTFEYLRAKVDELGKSKLFEDVKVQGYGLNGNHPLGVYRSGHSGISSVVDPYLRAYDHPNLYVLGGGAFNSTAAVNPTLTIVAHTLWALRDKRLSF